MGRVGDGSTGLPGGGILIPGGAPNKAGLLEKAGSGIYVGVVINGCF